MSLQDYLYEKPTLQKERLILRTMTAEDVPALKEWMSDPSIYKYWGMNPGKNDKNPKLLFTKAAKATKSFHWGIALSDDNKVIGELWIYLIENNRMAKVALRLSPAYHGQGFATEALTAAVTFCFEKTELKRLWTDVHVENIASYKVLEKVGFLREGHIRSGKMVNTYCDYYLYGMLKEDYLRLY